MFSKSFRFSALLLALGFVLSLAIAGCSDTERDNGNGPKPTPTPTTTDLRVDFSQISDNLFSSDVPVPSKVDATAVKVEFFMDEVTEEEVTPEYTDISEQIDENNVYNAGPVAVGKEYRLDIRFTDRESNSVVGRVMMTVTAEDQDGQCVVVLKDEDVSTAKVTFIFDEVLAAGLNTVTINGKTYEISDGQAMVTVDEPAQPGTNLFDLEVIAPQQSEVPWYGIIAVAYDYPVEVTDIHSDVTTKPLEDDFEHEMTVTFTFDKAATAKLEKYGTPVKIATGGGLEAPLTKNEDGLYTFMLYGDGVIIGREVELHLGVISDGDSIMAMLSIGKIHLQPENHELNMNYTIDESQVEPIS